RAFLAALVDPTALPAPQSTTDQSGYTYLDRRRRLIGYNLHEPGVDRLHGPALPYARAMLGARTIHEWAHLAVDAGWVPQTAPVADVAGLTAALVAQLDAVITAAPPAVRKRTAPDLAALTSTPTGPHDSPGAALVQILVGRFPDYQANLLASRFWSLAESETYVRHNIRTLRQEYAPAQLWRMLARYVC